MPIQFKILNSIAEIDSEAWNQLWASSYPFVQHGFLDALETSGSVSPQTGWRPQHIVGYDADEELVFAIIAYLKEHSWGEYVFDFAWADAYQRNHLAYYPKLLTAAPFTPATGPRWAISEKLDQDSTLLLGLEFLQNYCLSQHISSWHCLFTDEHNSNKLSGFKVAQRIGCQFHWHNKNYSSFDDFLEHFTSRKRKNLRKERQTVTAAGVQLQRLTGNDITQQHWDNFYQFYHTTYLKRSGSTGYLNRDFFQRLATTIPDQLLMVVAEHNHQPIAAALFFFDNQKLYGRYWGCRQEVSGLHFEACYYQGIEFAIERGIQIFDPGAQGEHKIQRGFEPTFTYSNHWLAHPEFSHAINDFLQKEKPSIIEYHNQCSEHLPFKDLKY